MTSNEKRMLYIFGIMLVICATGLFFYFRITWNETGLNDLNKKILDIENSVRTLQVSKDIDVDLDEKIKLIDSTIENEKKKFFNKQEIDIAGFGLRVKELIVKNNLRIENQRTITQKDVEFIEFRCLGTSYQLSSFLKAITDAEKYFRIDSLNVQSKNIDGIIDAKMRITYETIDSDNK